MGACATKPKVAKDGDIAPLDRPEAEPEKEAVAVAAEKEAPPAENVQPISQRDISVKENEPVNKERQIDEGAANVNPVEEVKQSEAVEPTKLEQLEAGEECIHEQQKVEEKPEEEQKNIVKQEATTTAMEEVKQPKPVEPIEVEQLEAERSSKEKQAIPEICIDQQQKEEEKQQSIVTEDNSAETQANQECSDKDTTTEIVTDVEKQPIDEIRVDEPEKKEEKEQQKETEGKPVGAQVTLLDPQEKQEGKLEANEKQGGDEKTTETQVTTLSEKPLNPEEKQVNAGRDGSNVVLSENPNAGEVETSQTEKDEKN